MRGRHTGLPFPANAEIVLEGFVHPETVVPEGPFGDWTGTYTEPGRKRPLCEITAIYFRNDPILLGFVPQSLPDEYSRYRAITRSALLKRNIETAGVPDVKAVWAHDAAARACSTASRSASATTGTPCRPGTSPASATSAPTATAG